MDIHLPSFNDSIAAKEALVVFTISSKGIIDSPPFSC